MKALLKKVNYFFQSLIRNERTCSALSKAINKYLDDPNTTIVIHSEFVCTLEHPTFKKLPLWISNYPYAYGNFYPFTLSLTPDDLVIYDELKRFFGNKLPDRRTVYRLHEAVENKKKELGYYPDKRLLLNPKLTPTQKQEIIQEIKKFLLVQ
jgi:hypothetical protein